MAKGKYQQWLEPEGLIRIEGWARDGLTDEQIAKDKMHISYSTFREWRDKYPALSAVLKRGKEVVDREVENALFRNAVGYDYHEVTRERRFNKKTGEFEMIVTKDIVKHQKPDTTAQIFWLKNRKKTEWMDHQQIEVSGLEHEQTKLDDLIGQMRGGD